MKKQVLTMLAAAVLAVSASSAMAAGDVAKGKAKAASCAACHGANGVSMIPTYPNLKGQKAAYFVKQLKAFKSGDRKDPTMNAMAKPLSDADMDNLAAYYASMK
ncbi:MAG: cytochrome c [Gammaproteobacteria bacterium]|nr:cytochrome c [Gammaproteobacteria bacterium]